MPLPVIAAAVVPAATGLGSTLGIGTVAGIGAAAPAATVTTGGITASQAATIATAISAASPKPSKVDTPNQGGVPGNILPGVDLKRINRNASSIAGTAMGTGLGVGLGIGESVAKAVGTVPVGSMAEGQFIGAERDPTPAHAKLILKPPMFFVSGNDLVTRRLKI